MAADRPGTHFDEGLRVDSVLGAWPYVAQGRLGLARALAASGDLARTTELARTAAAEARRLDMPGLFHAADAFLAKTGLTSRTELTRWYLQQPPH
jgi:hypothetical protein